MVLRPATVLVAGAGLAGLTAARELSREGTTITIVEGRDRVGGRTWTLRGALADGQHGELGGEFIDAAQKEMRTLCDELGLRLVRILRAGFTHRFRGEDGQYHVSRTRPWAELERCLRPLLTKYEAAGGDSSAAAVREMATISLREWLRQQQAGAELHSMANALRGFFLADPDDLSVLPVVEQLASGGSPAQAEIYRIAEGSDALTDALARGIRGRILLQHRLRAIEEAADRVIATVDDAHGHQQRLEADAIVIALPASTLREIRIRPPLAEDQWRAIRTLRYGSATKALVQSNRDPFRRRPPRGGAEASRPARARARAFATDTSLGAFWDGAEEQDSSRYSLLTFLAGGAASRALRERMRAGADLVLSDLCWLGMAGARVLGAHVYSWEEDPWARGGYAYVDPGFDPALRQALSRRAGRIVFAGEHTSSRWQGYMNGAVESGLRAARELSGKLLD